MKTIQVISLIDLMGMLANVKGARPATITALTDARLLKTGNPNKNVKKRSKVNVIINFGYENSVNNQRAREGSDRDFIASPRKWGNRLQGIPFVEHKGKFYIEAKVQKSLHHEYISEAGTILTHEQVEDFLPNKNSNADHQGVDKEVILRDYGIDTIEAINIDGESYMVDPATIQHALNDVALAV